MDDADFPIPDPADAWRERVRAAWDGRAAEWDASAGEAATSPDRPPEIERILAALRVQPGDAVLDAGCGSGHWAVAFAGRGLRVSGIDLSPEMIRLAAERADAAQVAIDWRIGDLAALPFPDAAFDAVQARVALQFVPNVPAALRELRRVLRPGGRLLASVPGALSPIYRRSWRRHLLEDPPEVNWLLPWELEHLLEHAGWTIRDGWGAFDGSLTGPRNPFDPAALAPLDRRLQQAAATAWTVVAD